MSSSALATSGHAELAPTFDRFRTLKVRQKRRWLEAILSFEMVNRYDVVDHDGAAALQVAETSGGLGGFFKRLFLGPMRPFSADVTEAGSGARVLSLRRPFRFFFHRLEIHDGRGQYVGAVQKRWSWLRRIYDVLDDRGQVVATLFGPILKPWTFEVQVQGRQCGAIRKRWSGLATELFTDADNFGVELEDLGDPQLKALTFAATVLIDVVHFERSKG